MLVKFIEAFRYLMFAMAADQLLPTGCQCSIAFFLQFCLWQFCLCQCSIAFFFGNSVSLRDFIVLVLNIEVFQIKFS